MINAGVSWPILLIIVTASSIFDVGRGPGASQTSSVLTIRFFIFSTMENGKKMKARRGLSQHKHIEIRIQIIRKFQ